MDFDQICDKLTSLYDVTTATAAETVNERLADMVARSTALRAVISLGTTVASQASYSLASNVVQIRQLEIAYTAGTKAYDGVTTLEELWAIDRGDAELVGCDGVVAIEADSDSTMTTDNFRLSPAPTESGATMEALVALRPATITYGSATALPIPVDHHKRLLAGCKATLSDDEGRQDQAAKWDGEFEAGVKLLEASVNKRGKGSGRHRLHVSGYDIAR